MNTGIEHSKMAQKRSNQATKRPNTVKKRWLAPARSRFTITQNTQLTARRGKQTAAKKSFSMPAFVWLLVILQGVLGIGACFGGGALVLDPTGGLIGMPGDMMIRNWFPDYLLPGLILFVVLGIFPLVTASGLIWRWGWRVGEALNPYRCLHWSWASSLYTGFATLIWIMVEVYILQAVAAAHLLYMAVGLAIQILTLLPPVIRHCRRG